MSASSSATTTTATSTTASRFGPATILQLLAALGVLAGGLLHLQIWNDSKKDIPSQVPGVWVVQEGFLLNVAASVIVAGLLVATAFGAVAVVRRFVLPAALVVELGSIVALVLSRGSGFFGWSEKGWDGDAKKVLVVEIVAAVLAAAALALSAPRSRREA